MFEKSSQSIEVWSAFLENANIVESNISSWERSLDEQWKRKTTYNFLPNMVEVSFDYYSDLQIGKVWNQYRCARIILSESIILVLKRLMHLDPSRSQACLADMFRSIKLIRIMLSGIYDSIPFHMQQVGTHGELVTSSSMKLLGGEHLLWPLDFLLHNYWSSEKETVRALTILQHIGELGLGQASKIAQTRKSTARQS